MKQRVRLSTIISECGRAQRMALGIEGLKEEGEGLHLGGIQ